MTMLLPAPMQAAPLISDWIQFVPDRSVPVLSGRVELGQGNLTAILQIAADELDIPPEMVAITGADTTRTPNEGFTAGSMSIMQGSMSVRMAASAARHLLLAEAPRLLQSTPDLLSIDEGQILREGDETALYLWSLAVTVDLAVPAADHAAPKRPEARRVAGLSLPRIDLAERITEHTFLQDIVMDGLLHGRPVHPPSMLARLVSLDLDGLSDRPGVVEVVCDGSFVGVVAETEPQAIAAVRWARSRAEWSNTADSPDDAIRAIADSQGEIQVVHSAGDPDQVTGQTYETHVLRPYLSHASIGPSGAIARWQDGRLAVWTHSQGVFPLRAALNDVFQVGPGNIDVLHRPGAGCYGHNGADDVALDVALLARAAPGRPVMVVWSRADEFSCAPLGPAMSTHARAVLDRDNRITAMEVTANSVPHGNRPGRNGAPNLRASAYLAAPFPIPRSADIPPANGGGADRNSVPGYAIPHQRIAKRLVHDLPYRTSSMHGLGAFANVCAIETLIDEIAQDIGEDPIAFRLRHLDNLRGRAVIEGVAANAQAILSEKMPEGAGWGLGYARYKNTAAYCAIIARIEVDEAVRVTNVHACLDTGEVINPDGAINQTEGGILLSISWTLKEAVSFDGPNVATQSWADYPILTFSEVPEVQVRLIAQPEEPALGCAEAAQGPMGAALGNALRRVIGVPVRDMPLTRDAILRALA